MRPTRYRLLPFTWRPLSEFQIGDAHAVTERFCQILMSWRGTPYLEGQQTKGAGVDCVRFVCAVLDALYQEKRPPTFAMTLPPDAAMHSREGALSVMRKIRELYMPNVAIEDGSIEPGDVVVTGPVGGGPGHAMIVGSQPNTLWHATPGVGVAQTGLGVGGAPEVHRVYRCTDRRKWISNHA